MHSPFKGTMRYYEAVSFCDISLPVKSRKKRKYAECTAVFAPRVMSLPSPIRRRKAGRPMKHVGVWEMANRRICISKDTYAEWRHLRNELDLRNDD